MTGGGLGWPDGGFKLDDMFLISDPLFSGGRFLGGFLATTSFTYGGSQIGSIPGCDEDPVKVAAWLVIAWINWMEAKNVDA